MLLKYVIILCIIKTSFSEVNVTEKEELPCDSEIYCNGHLLHDVQMARVYPDSKTFVDMKLKYSVSEILFKYTILKNESNNNTLSRSELVKFVNENLETGDELEPWSPQDFTENPSIISQIKDPCYKTWAIDLNNLWKTLARKVKIDVKNNPDRYSLIWVPNGFIIPGGRFKELYYWDTYWIVNGLLICNMVSTARGVIDNIISLVHQFGFMPNGGRVYYKNRSQPPMLILMVLSYYQETQDFDYVQSVIPDLESEFEFWMNNRMINFTMNGEIYKMAHYIAKSNRPRPESYKEDYDTIHLNYSPDKSNIYTNITSGAETGWDFSSRWFLTHNETNRGHLNGISTPDIIPVDLNSILHKNAKILSSWFSQMGNVLKSNKYDTIARDLLHAIQSVMWRPDQGCWFDWIVSQNKHHDNFFASNLVPLWTESYNMPKNQVSKYVLQYLKFRRIMEMDGSIKMFGIPTSLYDSSEQWDYPNAWPPLQAFIIQGLDKTNDKDAQTLAANLADVWLRSNFKGLYVNSSMFEKYDMLNEGASGYGGEYVPQSGFGWTNGVVFELLHQYGKTVSYKVELKKDVLDQTTEKLETRTLETTLKNSTVN